MSFNMWRYKRSLAAGGVSCIPQLGDVANEVSDKTNKAQPPHIRQNLPPQGGTLASERSRILPNVSVYRKSGDFIIS